MYVYLCIHTVQAYVPYVQLICHILITSAQTAFDAELVEACERQQEVVAALRSEVSLLDNPESAEQELDDFEQFSAQVKEKRGRLSAAADWAGRCV